jgi:hypothetical protein
MSYDSIELTLSRVGEQLPDRLSPSFKPRRADVAGRCPTPKAIKRDCDEPALRDGVDNPTHSSRPPNQR